SRVRNRWSSPGSALRSGPSSARCCRRQTSKIARWASAAMRSRPTPSRRRASNGSMARRSRKPAGTRRRKPRGAPGKTPKKRRSAAGTRPSVPPAAPTGMPATSPARKRRWYRRKPRQKPSVSPPPPNGTRAQGRGAVLSSRPEAPTRAAGIRLPAVFSARGEVRDAAVRRRPFRRLGEEGADFPQRVGVEDLVFLGDLEHVPPRREVVQLDVQVLQVA